MREWKTERNNESVRWVWESENEETNREYIRERKGDGCKRYYMRENRIMKNLWVKICLLKLYRMKDGERKRVWVQASEWLVLFIWEVVSKHAKEN